MLEKLREQSKDIREIIQRYGGRGVEERLKIFDEMISFAQLILDSKGWPKEEPCQKGEQYWMWNSPHNVFEYGKKIGFNEALLFCLASHAKEKAELIGKIPSEKDWQDFLTECSHLGTCIYDKDCHENKDMAQSIHSELMRRLKNE